MLLVVVGLSIPISLSSNESRKLHTQPGVPCVFGIGNCENKGASAQLE